MSTYAETLAKTDQMQERIKAFGVFPPEIKKKLQYKFRLDWNYYSNSMEGNTLTKAETRDVMVGVLNVAGKPLKDVLEMKGHNDVVESIMRMGKEEVRLSEKRIKDIHKGIMHEDAENKKDEIGHWKKHPNHIINYKSEKFNFAAPDEVAEKVHELLNWLNAELDKIAANKKGARHPLDVIFQFHLDYLTIHPFQDGNGRTARILTNLLLISLDYPPIIIRKEDKDAYYNYLGDIQGYGGKPDLLFTYMGNLLLRSQQLVLDALEGKEIEEHEDIEKEIALWKKEQEGKPLFLSQNAKLLMVFKNTIRPILELIQDKTILSFGELFNSFEYSFNVNDNYVFSSIEELSSVIESINSKKGYSGIKHVNGIDFRCSLQHFKRGENDFTVQIKFQVNLESGQYNCYFNNTKLQTINFDAPFSSIDIERLATNVIKLIFEQIKQKAG